MMNGGFDDNTAARVSAGGHLEEDDLWRNDHGPGQSGTVVVTFIGGLNMRK